AYPSAGFIIEEGFPVADLKRVLPSMRDTAEEAGVQIVTGDTKVVERGGADKLFINTAGIGLIEHGGRFSAANVRAGDRVILSGPMGDHGATVMIARGELELETDIRSDVAPLWSLVEAMLEAPAGVCAMGGPAPGGGGGALRRIALASRVGLR